LSKILAAIQASPQGLCLQELASQVGSEPSAVEGMAATLVEMGRLVRASPVSACDGCGLATWCLHLKSANVVYGIAAPTE
jgi:hypothetical protein